MEIWNMTGSSVQYLQVDAQQAGQRLDNFLLARLVGVPRTHIYRIVRTGQVRVNRGRIRPDYRIKDGDCIRLPPIRLPSKKQITQPGRKLVQKIEQSILYDEAGLVVVNKPSGLAVHGGTGVDVGLIDVLRAIYPESLHLALVHRLDRDTSGCLLVAKDRNVLLAMHQLMRDASLDKQYFALLSPAQPNRKQVVKLRLRKQTLRSGERMVCIDEAGKPACSAFVPVQQYSQATLMQVRPHTGRTHQIRVHAASLGSPIVGDEKYGDTKLNKRFRKLGLNRLFLHASRLEFHIPTRKSPVLVESDLPESLLDLLERL